MDSQHYPIYLWFHLQVRPEKTQSTDLVETYPLDRVDIQHPLDSFFSLESNVLGELVFALHYLHVQFLSSLLLEGKVSTHYDEKDDTQRPDVRHEPIIGLPSYHLWRRIARTPACSSE